MFRNLDCLSLVVCSNTTLLKLQTVLFLFFSKFCTSKSGVRLIYGCGLYTDVYGILQKLTSDTVRTSVSSVLHEISVLVHSAQAKGKIQNNAILRGSLLCNLTYKDTVQV